MADENYDREPEQDEGSDKEQNLANLRKAKEAAEKRAQEREQELQEIRAEQRRSSLESILTANGLPATAAKHYPADAEVTEDSVLEFASDFGVQPQGPSGPPSNEEASYDAYTRYINHGTFTPEDDIQVLQGKLRDGVEKIMNRGTMPTQAERDEHNQLVRQVNSLNKRMEKEVKMGRVQPHQGGFGGRVNPPAYADKSAQAIADMN